MFAAPATLVILFVVGLLIIAGGVLLGASGAGVCGRRCPELACRHRNPPSARFCARCGAKLN